MATPIRIKRSSQDGKRPTLEQLGKGELALNIYNGHLFAERDTGGVGIATTIALLTPWQEEYGGGEIRYSGIVSATTYYGDGSNLTGIATDSDKLDGQQGSYYLDYSNFVGIATDADKLDGQDGSYYLNYSNFVGIATDADKLDGQQGSYYLDYSNFVGIATDSDKLDGQQGSYYLDYSNFVGIATDADKLDGQDGSYYLDYSNFVGIATDADKLDGQQGSYYLDYSNFVGIATDSDKLDGQDGSYYLDYSNFVGIATDADKLDGQQGSYYLDYSNFVGVATDADKLDGQDGSYYLDYSNFVGVATDADKLDGQQGSYYLDYSNFVGIATDADKLDGQDGSYYLDYSNFVGIATDADKLDGQQGSYYLDYSNFVGIATDSDKLDGQQGSYYLDYSNFVGIATDSDKLDGQQGSYYLDYSNFVGIATDADKLDGQQGSYYLDYSNFVGIATDSDKLDGIQASSFLRSDAADTKTGITTFNDISIFGSNILSDSDNNEGYQPAGPINPNGNGKDIGFRKWIFANAGAAGATILEGVDTTGVRVGMAITEDSGIIQNNTTITSVSGSTVGISKTTLGSWQNNYAFTVDQKWNNAFFGGTVVSLGGIAVPDNAEIRIGGSPSGTGYSSGKLKIYHDGTDNWIHNNSSGDTNFLGSFIFCNGFNGTSQSAEFGSSKAILKYDSATKLETTSSGIDITGIVTSTSGVVTYYGDGTNLTLTDSVALGGDTTGDYVASISGTANQIAVDATSGEGTTPVISIPTNPTLPGTTVTIQNDLQVNRHLNVTGNITVGGTSGTLFTETLQVADADLILGVRTDANGNDVSTDTTASHGGIAIASTEGTPLVTLVNPGAGETLPATYKKIMWFEQGAFAGLGTDAWLINYGVGIGSTQVPNNVVLAAGDVHITNNDIKKVRDVNASGIITASTFVSNVSTGTSPLTVTSTTLVSNLNADKLDGQEGTYYLDYANFSGIATDSDKLDGEQGTYYLDYANFSGIATDSDKLDGEQGTYYLDYANFSGIATDSDKLDGEQGTYYLDYANFTNTPTIPTVNNATLTLETSGDGISGSDTFTANQSTDTTFTVTVSSASTNQGGTLVYRDVDGGFDASDVNFANITASDNINVTGGIDVTGIITAPNYHGGRYNQFIAGLDAGGSTGVGSTSIETIIAIGSSAAKDFGDTTDSIGDGRLVVIGHNTLSNELGDNRTSRYSQSVVIGNNTLDRATSCTNSTIIGDNIGSGLTNPTLSTLIGSNIGIFKFGSDDGRSYAGNISIGHMSMLYNDGVTEFNTVMGYQAGSVRNGSYNTFLGYKAGQSHINGNSSIGIGYVALGRVSGGNGNIGIGSEAGYAPAGINLSGEGNVFIGRKAGYGASTVSGNVVLIGGYSDQPVNIPISDGDNQLVIGAGATAWFYGDRSYNIGIGTTSPTEKLDVIGTVKATSFIKNGGASTEFLKADGSVDTNTYITSADGGDAATLDGIDSGSFLRSDQNDSFTSGTLTFTSASSGIKIEDLSILKLGSGTQDFSATHNGTDTYFSNRTGDLIIQTVDTGDNGNGDDIIIKAGTGKTSIFAHNNGAVELWNDGSKKFETTNNGIAVSGIVTAISGVVTYYGDGSQLIGVSAGSTWSVSATGIHTSKNVGIGTTARGNALSVGGTITELYNGTHWNVVTQADVGYGASQVPLNQYLGQLAFLDDYHPNGLRRDGGGSDDVVVGAAGSVGIGTTNPQYKLHVVGDTNIDGTFTVNGVSVAISDGDKGDITVSGSGTTFTIDDNVVTHAKYQQVATDSIIGRTDAGSGNVTALTAAEVRGIINVENGADVTDATNVAAAGAVMDGDFTSNGFMKRTGAGTYAVDTNTYLTTETQTLDDVVGLGSDTTQTITVGTATTGIILRPDGNLNVTGVSTFTGDVGIGTDDAPLAKLDVRDGSVYVPGGTFDASSLGVGNDSKTNAALVIDRSSAIYFQASGYLRNLIEPANTVINIGQQNTSLISEINLKPGTTGGQVKLHAGGFSDNVKLETTSYGIYVTGAGNTSTIGGAANLVLDPSAVGDNTGTVTILGNLQVDGTQTVINSTTMTVDDLNITLADGAANASAANGAGLTIDGASATLTYASTGDKWVFNKAPYYNTNRILTTADEGTGNGLDADTVDGLEASQFLRSDAADTATGKITFSGGHEAQATFLSGAQNFDNIKTSGFFSLYNVNASGHTNAPFQYGAMISVSNTASGLGMGMQLANERLGNGLYVRGMNDTNDTWSSWAEVWTSNTDGSGSGLDADTVDGIQGASFLRSDANDSSTGLYYFAAGAYSANVTYGGRSIQTNLDINSTSMRGGVLVRNANDFRSETDSASFMHYDAYNTSATSYAFRAAKGTTLADTFWVKGDGNAYFSGDVGIGTDNPDAVLDVNPGYGTNYTGTFTAPYSYTPTTGEIKIGSDLGANASAGDYVGLRFSVRGNGSGNAQAGIFAVREQAEGNGKTSLAFATRNWGGNFDITEKVRITADGNLGVGTDNPTQKLHVYGDGTVLFGPGSAGGKYLQIGANSSSAPDSNTANIEVTNGNLHLDAAEGAFGVYLNYYGGAGGVLFGNGSGGSVGKFASNGILTVNTTTTTGTANQNLQVNGGAYVSGNLGVGITNPGYKLEVAGDIKLADTGTLWFSDTSGSVEKIVATTSTLDYYADSEHRFYESDNNAERATFDVNNASGRLYFDGDSDTYFTREATDCHVFVNAGSESVRINASGNVGINTTAPTTDLDVNGEIKTIDINVTSDINLKTNVKSIQDPLEKVLQIRGVTFDWKSSHKSSAGVIAQEVEKVLPQLVNGEDTKTVNYNGLIGLLVEAVKAQQEEINMLKDRLK